MHIKRDIYEKYVTTYSPGKVIFQEGDPGNVMYVIIQGEVEIRKRTAQDAYKTLIVFHKGDIFGEMALIEKKPRSATAIATQPTKALVMNEALLDSMIGSNPDFARKMIRMLAERIRKANSLIQSLTVTGRKNQIIKSLNEYAREHGLSTYKGMRVNLQRFADWAQERLGIRGTDILSTINLLLKEGLVKPSVRGKEEIIVAQRTDRFGTHYML